MEFKQLTNEQKTSIKTSWAIPYSSPTDSGVAILMSFFERFPQNQEKFYAFKNKPLSELKNSASFRAHADNIMAVFNSAVEALDKPNYLDELQQIWVKIGESHAKRKISEDSFNELKAVVVDILSVVCKLTDPQKVAWSVLLDNAYMVIFDQLKKE